MSVSPWQIENGMFYQEARVVTCTKYFLPKGRWGGGLKKEKQKAIPKETNRLGHLLQQCPHLHSMYFTFLRESPTINTDKFGLYVLVDG